jgi:siroheme synthase
VAMNAYLDLYHNRRTLCEVLQNLKFPCSLSGHIKSHLTLESLSYKDPNKHSLPQEETNRMLVNLAKKGHTITRLKGGEQFQMEFDYPIIFLLLRHHVQKRKDHHPLIV